MIEEFLKEKKELIDENINRFFSFKSTESFHVFNAARYSLVLGGKRIRPIIMLEFANLCKGNIEEVMPFAVALEMIHTYSLIHDDLPCMDDDDFRRGNPSCHKKYGEDIALLAGDALLTEAFNIACKSSASADKIVKSISVLAHNAGINGMIGGQVLDLSFENIVPNDIQLKDMCFKKTGGLLLSAAQIGCILSGADEQTLKIASDYAYNVAIAFQIIDDILDVTGDQSILGKPIGSDINNSKTTFVSLYGIDGAKTLAKEFTDEALRLLETLDGDTENLKKITKFLLFRNY